MSTTPSIECTIPGWRIFRVKNGKPSTLYHGLSASNLGRTGGRRSKVIPLDLNVFAELKMVHNPGKITQSEGYLSGFHVLPSKEAATIYLLTRFARPHEHVICKVWVDCMRKKPNSVAKVADTMYVETHEWNKALTSI